MDFSKTRVKFWSATQMTKVCTLLRPARLLLRVLGSSGTQLVVGAGQQNAGPKVADDKRSRYLPESQKAFGPGFPRYNSRDEAAMDVAATRVRQTWLERHQRGAEMRACGAVREKLTSWRDRLHYENERLPPVVPEKPASCESLFSLTLSDLSNRTRTSLFSATLHSDCCWNAYGQG
jgi:hypothetical protein